MEVTETDYFKLDHPDKKMAFLKEKWGLADTILLGKVVIVDRVRGFFLIDHIMSPALERLRHPFDESKYILKMKHTVRKGTALPKLGDYVTFHFQIYTKTAEPLYFIEARPNSITVLTEQAELYEQIGLKVEELFVPAVLDRDKLLVSPNLFALQKRLKLAFTAELESLREQLSGLRASLADAKDLFEQDQADRLEALEGREEAVERSEQAVRVREAEVEVREGNLKRDASELEERQKLLIEREHMAAEQLSRLERLGFPVYGHNSRVEAEELSLAPKESFVIEDEAERVAHIHQWIWHQSDLQYDPQIIEQLHTVLKTRQFIILTGPSGTGKTSLVEAYAKAVGASHTTLSVKSNWTDSQDLLGFYNPLERYYVSTPFLDAMVEARKQPEKLHLICLDEMNLTHIEYYFAEFLTKLGEPDAQIPLYSAREWKLTVEEVSAYISAMNRGIDQPTKEQIRSYFEQTQQEYPKDYFRYKRLWESTQLFLPVLDIPDNVRFLGTMNVDGTTKQLSPKVIDRSYVLYLGRSRKLEAPEIGAARPLHLTKEAWSCQRQASPSLAPAQDKVFKKLIGWNKEYLTPLQAAFDKRVERHIKDYLEAGAALQIKEKTMIDHLAASKLLPRLFFAAGQADDRKDAAAAKWFAELGKAGDQMTKQTLSRMMDYAEATGIYTYWGHLE